MSLPRFSLRWLLSTLSFFAVGCGLLFYAKPITAQLTFAAALLALFAAVPLSVYRNGQGRAFWFGAALFGLGYLAVICGPWQAPDAQLQMVGIRERLPTTKLLELAYGWVPTEPVGAGQRAAGGMGGGEMFQMGMGGMGGGAPARTRRISRPRRVAITDWSDFSLVGHSLWAIVIAAIGAVFSGWCQRTSRP